MNPPVQYVTWLALQDPTDGVKGFETNSLGSTVLQHGNIGRSDADGVGKLSDTHSSLGKENVDRNHNRHVRSPGPVLCETSLLV